MKPLLSVITVIILLFLSANSMAECGPMSTGHNLLSCIESSDPELYGYGLGFISLTQERYDLIFPEEVWHSPAAQALVKVLRSPQFKEAVVALGGHMKNTVALAWADRLVIAPHIGDLDSPRSRAVFENPRRNPLTGDIEDVRPPPGDDRS